MRWEAAVVGEEAEEGGGGCKLMTTVQRRPSVVARNHNLEPWLRRPGYQKGNMLAGCPKGCGPRLHVGGGHLETDVCSTLLRFRTAVGLMSAAAQTRTLAGAIRTMVTLLLLT